MRTAAVRAAAGAAGRSLSPASRAAIAAALPPCPEAAGAILAGQEATWLEAFSIAVCITDAEGRLTAYNAAARDLWGWSPPLGEQRWNGAWRLVAPDGNPLPHDQCPMAVCLRENRPVRGLWAYAERPDGSRVPYAPFPTPLRDAQGRLVGAVNLMLDISGLHAVEAARAATEARFQAAQEASPDGFIVLLPIRGREGTVEDFRIDYANPAAARIFGCDRQRMLGAALRDLIRDWPDVEELLRGYARVLATGEALAREAAHEVGGRRIWVRSQTSRLGEGIAIAFEDATERHETEARIRHLALHDPLTGLANRLAFQERLAAAAAAGQGVAVVSLDLDGFRVVNDALGHGVGDALLQEAALRLRTCLGSGDLAARLGGDEFALLLAGPGLRRRAEATARRVREALTCPFTLGAYRASVGVTIGIAMAEAGEAGTAPEALLRHANLALFHARAEARGGIRVFAPRMAAERETRLLLHAALREALAEGTVSIAYQPIHDLRQNRPTGYEALLRWTHPQRGTVAPAEFIPIAEETGLILPLGAWVLRRACADAASWPASVKVSVNLSPVQFVGGEVARVVREALEAAGLPPQRLELEVTESTLLQQNEAVLASLRELRAMGVRLALDDFGTGYASLGYLRAFPFDKIKIDQSFVRDAVERPDCLAIVRSVAGLAAELGMTATAEGVEGPEHLAMVRGAGCAEAQGYHLGRPLPLAEIAALAAR
ncbi:putative bifunctional diguanylate cyclase/phosphodiesterase [Roseicella aquatilis]|uniref:EAL domain-containing protein n=1 Tax=Roseicella aquatilis TaxID=2527868 RepID=A0A4R4D7D2_9PROT|nr:EAL domain-containing protein [Roseicella aquatilis]TCZ55545.1 EAL domain-containing protein [Roseicella aquatilis]